jgi:hypothetical protein
MKLAIHRKHCGASLGQTYVYEERLFRFIGVWFYSFVLGLWIPTKTKVKTYTYSDNAEIYRVSIQGVRYEIQKEASGD